MKKLLAKIRRILRDRRTRKLLTRTVSGFAALVVFVTTYALVLPAITMEAQADCGIEAHQHDASCYEDVLICEEEESDGHHHDDSCYTSSTELVCEIPEHSHDETCYDEEGNLICEQLEHTHDDSCYEERLELTCGLEESDGHHHDSSCYEQVLVCGKEVHTHSEACYHNSDTEAEADEMAVMSDAAYTGASAQSASAEETGDFSYVPEYGNENARTGEEATEAETTDSANDSAIDDQNTSDLDVDDAAKAKTQEGNYVPTLDPVLFEQILNKNTDIYYSHVEDGEVVEDSSEITDWEKIDHNTELGRNDILRVYLAYTIPAGSLNATNDTARYRLPSNIHLTDAQVKAINEIENGIAGQYINHDDLEVTDTENYHKYLGAEAVEGTRTPSDNVEEYLSLHNNQEYISAVVKVENVYSEKGDYLGQDLIFAFTPYSVQKNQHQYDSNGKPTKAGEAIKGWFTLDLNMEQVDWSEPEVSTYELPVEEAYDLSAEESENADIADDTAETSTDNGTADNTDSADSDDKDVPSDSDDSSDKNDAADSSDSAASDENSETTADSNNHKKVTTVERSERTADVVFVAEGTDAQNNRIQEIHTELTLVEEIRTETTAENTTPDEEKGETKEEKIDTSEDSEESEEGTEQTEDAAADETAEAAEPAAEMSEELPDEKEESNSQEYKDGTLTSEGTGYKITLDYKADAQIPENAYLKVSEITRESDPEAYEACLKEAEKTIPTDNKTTVDDKASRFFDIEILVDEKVIPQTEESEEKEDEQQDASTEINQLDQEAETETEAMETVDSTENTADSAETDDSAETADFAETAETITRKIEPAAPVSVNIQLFDTEISENVENYDAEQYKVVHFAEEGTQEIQDIKAQEIENDQEESTSVKKEAEATVVAPATEIQFEAESFSIYGVVYTVDFHWEVDGKTYDFSIPGGGFVSLEHLVEVLGIATTDENSKSGAENAANGTGNADDFAGEEPGVDKTGETGSAYEDAIKLNDVEVSETTKKFVSEVESVEFSSPELVWVGKVDSTTTVGGLKETNGIEVEYNAELTEEQIAEINSSTVEAGDWALISVQPFTSEESLTVIMKNGDQWTVRVTDNQLTSLDDIDRDEPYVLYTVQNGTTYVLKTDGTTEPLDDRSLDMLDNNYKWKIVWRYTDYGDNNKRYYSVIPETDPYKAMSLSWFKENLVKDSNTNQVYIEESSDGTFYFGGYNHVVLAFEDESFQGRHGPWHWRWRFVGWDRSTLPWTPIYEPDGIDDWHQTNGVDTEHSAVPVVIYKQEDVNAYEFYVKTDSLKQGYITGTDKDGRSFSENNIVEHTTVTNNNKKNKYKISAVPQSDKYLFDYWELDGVKQTYGATIPADTIPITANGNILTAHFKNNPNWNPETKPGREVDVDKLLEWMDNLKNQDHLMDPDGFSKTAEVYDYENRIYRIDLTAKSDFTTISGVADLGFVLDVSSSMRFPASLTVYQKNGENVRIKANDLWDTSSSAYQALDTNKTYYLIADEESTATVFRLNYSYSDYRWHRQDASKTELGDKIESDTKFQTEVGKTYQIYTAEGAAPKHEDYNDTTNRLDYLNWSISNTETGNPGLIQELQDILNNYLSRGDTSTDKANEPEVKIAYNTFNKMLQEKNYNFTSVKTNTPTITTNPGGGTSTDVGLLAAAGYKRNDSYYNTKNMNSYSAYTDSKDRISGYPDLRGATEFKENSMFQKDSTVGFNWDPNSSRYVVLITDGAPQRNGEDIERQMVKDAANYLKAGEDGILGTDDDITLITVGLSMGNVKKGATLLWELADRDENNDPYFYDAQDPSELKNVLYEILQTVTGKAIIVGNVTDTINDAFYPVDVRTGAALENGYVIDLKGNWIANSESALTKDQKAAGYGVISKGVDGLYTVRWTAQDFVPTGIGWQGTVYVKAKEDFFGGNTVRTNYDDAEFKATGYKGKPGDVTVNLASKYQEVKNQESPRVNVDELHFTDNSTEWTVYLGTEVNPKDELQRLFNKIEIEEEVFRSTTDKTRVNGNKEQYRYDLVEDTSDRRTEKTGNPVKFTLAELLEKLPQSERDKIDWNTLIRLANQPVKPSVQQGEPEPEEPEGGWNTGITLNYQYYNQDYPGTFTITLVKDHDPNKHVTDQVGDAVETYTLSVLFNPDYTHLSKDQGGQGDVEYHTGKYGTGSEGVGTGTEESTNTHNINVFSKPLDILKVDKDNAAITEKSATFELLRPWGVGDTDASKKVIFGSTPGYSGYKLDGADLTGTYYLVDTQETDTNTGIAHFGTGTDAAKLLSSAKDPYIIIEKAAPSGYAKDVNAKTITIVTDGTNMNLYSDLNKVAIYNANYPRTGNPYNWNQAVQFQVKEYNATSEMNQTSVIDYVNKYSGAKITLNQPVYTAGQPWKATGSARNPIYVFSNIENTKELIRDDESGVGVFRIRFINEPGGIDIIIHKVDDKGVALPGATFKLMNGPQIVTVSSMGDGVVIEPKVTGETVTIKDNTFTIPAGGVTIKNLQTSDTEYAIVEIDSPDGYVITNDTPVKFKVTSGELTGKTMTAGVEYALEGNDFTIPNTPGAALPHTGGPGTNLIYLFGIMLAISAGLGLVMKRRRRNAA